MEELGEVEGPEGSARDDAELIVGLGGWVLEGIFVDGAAGVEDAFWGAACA